MSNTVDDELEPTLSDLHAAIGQAVLSAAGLEQALLLTILHRRGERDGVDEQLARKMLIYATETGGRLANQLKSLGVSAEVQERLHDVLVRRNQLVHHPVEQPTLLSGLAGRDIAAAISWVESISSDCQTLVDELLRRALPGALEVTGLTPEMIDDLLHSRDLTDIEEATTRGKIGSLRIGLGISDADVQS